MLLQLGGDVTVNAAYDDIEVEDLRGELADQPRTHGLRRELRVLRFSGCHGRVGDAGAVAAVARP